MADNTDYFILIVLHYVNSIYKRLVLYNKRDIGNLIEKSNKSSGLSIYFKTRQLGSIHKFG
jgi:hypothetical protein